MSSRYLRTVPKKTYTDQAWCPVARTLDLIGERWTLLILRDLLLKGPQRFQDLQNSLAGAAPNTLSARLKALEKQGLRSEEHTSELQSLAYLVCRLLLEKKKKKNKIRIVNKRGTVGTNHLLGDHAH